MQVLNYKDGYCLAFARALKRAFNSAGYKVLMYDVVEPARNGKLFGLPHHIVVKFDNKYFDIDGPHEEEELLAEWQVNAEGVDITSSGNAKETQVYLEPHVEKRSKHYKLKTSVYAEKMALPKARMIVANAIR